MFVYTHVCLAIALDLLYNKHLANFRLISVFIEVYMKGALVV